jgi:hypothetical protein
LRILDPPAGVELLLPALDLRRAGSGLVSLAAVRFGDGVDQRIAVRVLVVDEFLGDLPLRQVRRLPSRILTMPS